MILKVTFPPSDRYSKRKKEQKKKLLLRPSKQNKQEAYLRSIELSVGKKLFFCARICLSFSCNYWFIL